MTDSGITEKPSLSKDTRLRQALLTDLNALVYICRKCFPEYYRWQSIYPSGEKWWRVVLESQSAQTWVAEDTIGIFAFNVLVLDSTLWKTEGKRRNGSLISRVFSIFCCLSTAVWNRLWKLALRRLTYRRPVRNSLVERSKEKIAWSEITAVLPRMRKRGGASLLIRSGEQRALAAGATILMTHVESENIPSRRMREKMGYALISENKGGCLYVKYLTDTGREVE